MADQNDPDAPVESHRTGSSAPRPMSVTAATRYRREDIEFSRSTAYFDATYALATTLLVTTLDPGANGWSSWSNLRAAVGDQLIAFAISFAVVASYWWTNHRFVASLEALSPRIIGGIVASLAFIVLLPFTTEGIAESGSVATIVYAVNVALVSSSATLLYLVAWRQRLFAVMPDPDDFRIHIIGSIDTPIVFLLTIPVAVYVSPVTAKYCWLLLFPTGMLHARWAKARRAARSTAV